jgi:cytochrome c553
MPRLVDTREGLKMIGVRYVLSLGALGAVLSLGACAPQPASESAAAASTQPSQDDLVARGKVLVTVGGCHDCHSPKVMGPNGPEPDMSRMLSGHPETEPIPQPFKPSPDAPWVIATTADLTTWSGPWGISFPANLTPDTNTGLRSGVWSEEQFIKALRTGKHVGVARDILPPMPWPMIGQLSDDDLKAIWAYLGSIPPIVNHVPDPIPPAQ